MSADPLDGRGKPSMIERRYAYSETEPWAIRLLSASTLRRKSFMICASKSVTAKDTLTPRDCFRTESHYAVRTAENIPNVEIGDIYTGNGVSELINLCMQALLNDGDEILIPSPDYPLWTATATLAGGKVVHYICDEESEWYPDLADMEKKITDRTKAIVIINPNNLPEPFIRGRFWKRSSNLPDSTT